MKLIEMAVNEYRQELLDSGKEFSKATEEDPLRGGSIRELFKYFTENETYYVKSSDSEKLEKALDYYEDNMDTCAATVSFKEENLDFSNGKIVTNHGYSVVGMDNDFVYIVNPWDSSKTISYPKEDFMKNINNFSYVDLTEKKD